jgi:phosphohistidine phosphatase
MILYVIRHATAEEPGGKPDAERALSPGGREEARTAGRALRALKAGLERIVSSPYARARETAELIAQGLEPAPPVEVRDALASGASPEALLKLLGDVPGREVALVGHQPDLGHFLAVMLDMSGSGVISFRPATVACLEVDPEFRFRLLWFRNPTELSAFL